MRLSVAGIGHFAVFVGGLASAYVPGEREIDDEDGHQDQIDQEQHGHPVEPHSGLHLPGETVQHAVRPAVAPHEHRVHVACDAVHVVGSLAGQARVMACDAERAGSVVVKNRVSPGRTLSVAAAVAVIPVRLAR